MGHRISWLSDRNAVLQYLSERISQSWDNKASAIKVSNGTHVYLNTKRVLEYDVRKELADR